ncbi:flagellar motor protein MotB [Thiocystis violacea]|uniref:flagellar motor protein MotB n=1 Tax=Thiocystis violacea TaxID=13725 RepID=UPI001903C8E2|nr:flagellar motor protein MotB [Thiocystis violacea]MBK1716694.1 flagellar motor protein MotB [Thiocystis violacea]
MAIDTNKQPIIIKKVFKSGGHHGGAWKIAFADFATAMMAFFMLLWILGSTTKEQKAAISEYFNNPSAFDGVSASPSQNEGEGTGSKPAIIQFDGAVDMAPEAPQPTTLDQEQLEEMAAAQDQERLESLKELLEKALEQSETLIPYKEQLLIDIVSEGLRIQIVDKENRSMFDSGSTQLKSYTAAILKELGTMINQVPNRISLTGHTDARPLARGGFSNWELSTERANSARRALLAGGMQEGKIGRVVGFADTVPFDQSDPNNPINRRISIIVMNKKTDATIHEETTIEKELAKPKSP